MSSRSSFSGHSSRQAHREQKKLSQGGYSVAPPYVQGSITVRLVDEQPIFYYDLGSPYAYLAAERVNGLFAEVCGQPPQWQPVLLGGLFKRFGRDSWANGPGREEGMREVEQRASARALPYVRWPDPFPGNTLLAMRAATYAKEIGRTVSFSLAAFRQAFAAGRDLSDPDNVALAAAAAEIHPRAVLAAVKRDRVKRALREATDRAGDLGVRGVPSVAVAGSVFWGDDRLEEAARFTADLQAR